MQFAVFPNVDAVDGRDRRHWDGGRSAFSVLSGLALLSSRAPIGVCWCLKFAVTIHLVFKTAYPRLGNWWAMASPLLLRRQLENRCTGFVWQFAAWIFDLLLHLVAVSENIDQHVSDTYQARQRHGGIDRQTRPKMNFMSYRQTPTTGWKVRRQALSWTDGFFALLHPAL